MVLVETTINLLLPQSVNKSNERLEVTSDNTETQSIYKDMLGTITYQQTWQPGRHVQIYRNTQSS